MKYWKFVIVLISICVVFALVLRPQDANTKQADMRKSLNGLVYAASMRPIETDGLPDGKPIVLCFFCGCNPCRETSKRLSSASRRIPASNLLGVFSSGPQDALDFAQMTHFPGRVVLDSTGSVAKHYQVGECPRIIVVSQGTVAFTTKDGIPPTDQAISSIRDNLTYSLAN